MTKDPRLVRLDELKEELDCTEKRIHNIEKERAVLRREAGKLTKAVRLDFLKAQVSRVRTKLPPGWKIKLIRPKGKPGDQSIFIIDEGGQRYCSIDPNDQLWHILVELLAGQPATDLSGREFEQEEVLDEGQELEADGDS